MRDEPIPASSTGTETEAPSGPPPIESWTGDQLTTWRKTGETPAAPKPAEKPATSEPASGDPPAAGATLPDSDPDNDLEEIDETAAPKTRKRFVRLLTQRAELKAKLEILERQAAESKPKPAETTAAATAPAKPAEPLSGKPKPAPPVMETFQGTWEQYRAAELKYADDLAAWHVAEDRALRVQEQAQSDAAKTQKEWLEGWSDRSNKVREKHADFDAVLQATGDKVSLTPVMQHAIFNTPEGPDLAYYLGTHLAEAIAITKMDQVLGAMEIGRLRALISHGTAAAPAAASQPPSKPTTPAAPPPASELNGGNTAPVDEAAAAIAAGDTARYIRVMNAREMKKG